MAPGLQLRLTTLFTALVYLAPLLAGIADHPPTLLPAHAALFVLWTVVMRPGQWPRDRAGWRRKGAVVRAAATVAAQVLLVLVCFGIGRGAGAFLPALPVLPPLAPLALVLMTIPVARLTLDADWIAFATGRIDEVPEPQALRFEGDRADRLVSGFFDLPATTNDLALLERLTGLAPQLTSAALLDALARRIDAERRPCIAARRALILQATSPAAADTCRGRREPVRALRMAGTDRALLRLLALRLGRLVAERPLLRADCPSAEELRAALSPMATGAIGATAEAGAPTARAAA